MGQANLQKQKNIIHFAAHTKHIGLYSEDKAIEHFAVRLDEYRH